MKYLAFAAVLALGLGSIATAEELKSGPQPGEGIKPFIVEKIAGAEDDGIEVGKTLCYRCRNLGAKKPQVMVFSRGDSAGVNTLLSSLNGLVEDLGDDNVRAFVNILDEDRDAAVETAKKTAETNKLTKIPAVVPDEFENGPGNYGLNAKANVTVIFANASGKVVTTHALESLDEETAKKIVAEVKKELGK